MHIFRPSHKLLSLRPTALLKPQKAFTHQPYSGRKFPDLLYFPHFFRWLNNKVKFKYLQKAWDPDFSEGAFIYGSTQAICRITEIINQNNPDRLKHLLTINAHRSLRTDMELRLSDMQKHVIKLQPEDIKLLVPMKVTLIRDRNQNKSCAVLLKSLSMKWHEEKNILKLVLVVIESEFRRDYGHGPPSDWIISMFNIVQCVLLGGNSMSTQ